MKVTGAVPLRADQLTRRRSIRRQVRICHCTDCQTLSGIGLSRQYCQPAGHVPAARAARPRPTSRPAESGNQRAHGFCAGMRHADLGDLARAEPVVLRAAGRHARPARRSRRRRGRAGAARPCRGRWTSPASRAPSGSKSTRCAQRLRVWPFTDPSPSFRRRPESTVQPFERRINGSRLSPGLRNERHTQR